jgi:hypothetical protein
MGVSGKDNSDEAVMRADAVLCVSTIDGSGRGWRRWKEALWLATPRKVAGQRDKMSVPKRSQILVSDDAK